MSEELKQNKVLQEISTHAITLKDIEKIVLFGSRARGDNRQNSDYDLAVFGNVSDESKAELIYFCNDETETLCKFDILFIESLSNEKLLRNIENEGKIVYEQAK